MGPGLGPAQHRPHGSSGRGVPSLGLGDANIGEDLGSKAPPLGEGGPDLRDRESGLWSVGPGLGSRDESTDSGLGLVVDWGSRPPGQGLGFG